MNRGVLSEQLRSGVLRAARGSLANPSVRFGPERTGFYRAGPNNLVLGINKQRVIDATLNDVAIRSNAPGAGNVQPLAIIRANAMTANNQETSIDFYEVAAKTGAISHYRHSATEYGWKFYGFNAGLNATPILTLRGNSSIIIGGDLGVTGTLSAGALISAGAVTAGTDVIAARYLRVGGAAGWTGVAMIQGNWHGDGIELYNGMAGAVVYQLSNRTSSAGVPTASGYLAFNARADGFIGTLGDLMLYTSQAGAGRLILGAYDAARLVFTSTHTSFQVGGSEHARVTLSNGNWGFGTTLSQRRIQVLTGAAADGVWVGSFASTNSPAVTVANSIDATAATAYGTLGQSLVVNHFVSGTVVGDTVLTTLGSSAGRLILGMAGVMRIIIDTNHTQFNVGGAEVMRVVNTARVGIAAASPDKRLHLNAAAAGDGIYVGGGGTFTPTVVLGNNPVLGTANCYATLGLAHAAGHLMVNAASGDTVLYTSGAASGRLVLGTNAIVRMIIDQSGNTTFHTTAYAGVRLALKQSANSAGGSFRIYRSDTDAAFWDIYEDGGNYLILACGGDVARFGSAGNVIIGGGPGTALARFSIQQSGNAYDGGLRIHKFGDLSQFFSVVVDSSNRVQMVTPNGASWYMDAPGNFFPGGGYMLGLSTNPVFQAWTNNIVISSPTASYQLHMGVDSAGKPSTSTWSIVSDLRSKDEETIVPFRDGLRVLQRLRPVLYTYNGEFGMPKGARSVGFVAQELQAVAPKMVRALSPIDKKDTHLEGLLSVDLHAMPFLLMNAVLELAARIEELEKGRAA